MRARALGSTIAAAAMATAAPAAAGEPFSFLVTPTDQMALPGHVSGTEILPDGSLYTGHAEMTFGAGRALRPYDGGSRTLERGRYPVFRSSARSGRVRYSLTTFTGDVGGQPVNFARVTMRNLSRRGTTARWSVGVRHSGGRLKASGVRRFRFLRPATPERTGLYWQPGSEFDRSARHSFRGGSLTRDGLVLHTIPRAPRGGRRALSVVRRPARASTIAARAAYTVPLAARRSVTLDFRMPVVPLPAGSPAAAALARSSFERERAAVLRSWRRLFGRALRLSLPESKVEDAFYASLANVLAARYREPASGLWVQTVNKLQYHAFWLRDAAVMTHALDLAGLHDEAAENLAFFPAWQQPDGLYISRPGQLDGLGQALWAFGEHVRLTRDVAFAQAMFPSVARAVEWFERARAADPLGLMPPGDPGDNELASGHLAGDNFWAAGGLERAILLARAAGQPATADRWAMLLASYRDSLDRAVRDAAARSGGRIPPVLDAPGGQDWGNLWPSYPVEVYDAEDPAVGGTLRHARGRFREGIGSYDDGRLLHGYLGFRVWQTELLRGEQERVVRGLYDSLAHTTSTHGGFETGIPAFGSRSVDDNMSPHGWFAAELVALVRNMLVREDGAELLLMPALSSSWLEPGDEVAIRSAPTAHGRVSFRLRAGRGGARLSWSGPEGVPLRWPVPAAVTGVSAPGLSSDRRTIALTPGSGSIDVTWRLGRARDSYDEAVERLVRSYRRRGR